MTVVPEGVVVVPVGMVLVVVFSGGVAITVVEGIVELVAGAVTELGDWLLVLTFEAQATLNKTSVIRIIVIPLAEKSFIA